MENELPSRPEEKTFKHCFATREETKAIALRTWRPSGRTTNQCSAKEEQAAEQNANALRTKRVLAGNLQEAE